MLGALAQRARARFRVGHFLAAEGETAVFGLPTALYLDRCVDCRPEVEAALSGHFGRPIRMRLQVVDELAAASPAATAPDDEEPVDWDELGAAPSAVTSPVEHVIQAFEGAEIVEE